MFQFLFLHFSILGLPGDESLDKCIKIIKYNFILIFLKITII